MRASKRSGFTLVEAMVASVLSTVVMFVAVGAFLAGIGNWARGESWIDVQQQSRNGVRAVSDALREAMAVTVDSDGMGLHYRMPVTGSDGSFSVPMLWDGIDRRIYYEDGSLWVDDGATRHIAARNVITVDPFQTATNARTVVIEKGPYTAPAYRIFTADVSVNTRSVVVCLVTRSRGRGSETVHARHRETIFLRNVPSITR